MHPKRPPICASALAQTLPQSLDSGKSRGCSVVQVLSLGAEMLQGFFVPMQVPWLGGTGDWPPVVGLELPSVHSWSKRESLRDL